MNSPPWKSFAWRRRARALSLRPSNDGICGCGEKGAGSRISDLLEAAQEYSTRYIDNAQVTLLGIVSSMKKKITKSDATMAFLSVEDMYGAIEVIVFPRIFTENAVKLQEGNVILLSGRLSLREDEDSKVICDLVEAVPDPRHVPSRISTKAAKKSVFRGSSSRTACADYAQRNQGKAAGAFPALCL